MSAIKELTEVYRRENKKLDELLRMAGLEQCTGCGKWVDPWEDAHDGECEECRNEQDLMDMFS